MSRDVRVKPRVSSRTAALVRSPSENPNALNLASIAPGRRSSSSSSAENASSSGRKYSRSWMARTVTWISDEGGVELVQGTALGGVPEAERAGDPGSFGGGDGHRVHLGAVPQLQSMLQASQEAVGLGQLPGVVVVDVARRPELGQDGERRRRSQIGIESAVHELEQLHGELDVADATPAPLQLAVGEPAARQLDLAPGLEVTHRPQVVGGEDPRPQVTAGGVVEGGTETVIAGDRSGLEQRLELPGVGPPIPVRLDTRRVSGRADRPGPGGAGWRRRGSTCAPPP